MQLIFAKHWPLKAYYALAAMLALGATWRACRPSLALFQDWRSLVFFVVAILVAPVVGFLVSLPFAFIFVGPIYRLRAWLNGAPFHEGDLVQVLVGPHSGRVVRIHAVWEERGEVRVELGEAEMRDVADVFSVVQVCRDPKS